MEPNGQEYTLEHTPQRTTSIIMRKSPNNCTLVQRTAAGLVAVEMTEAAKDVLFGLLSGPERSPMQLVHEMAAAGITPFAEPKRRGRPPKSVGESS